ncbi:hypothetical protein [Streptomyces sp. NPDC052727]
MSGIPATTGGTGRDITGKTLVDHTAYITGTDYLADGGAAEW